MALKFKVGDEVRILSIARGSKNKVGEIGIVEYREHSDYSGKLPYRVKVGSRVYSNDNWHGEEELELVITSSTNLHLQLMKESKLKVGNVVRVTHKVPSGNLGWQARWASGMDNVVGKEATIITNLGDVGFRCDFGHITWSLPVHVLEFVKESKDLNKMKISKDYDAEVTDSYIKVGCQTITFEDFDKLAAIVAKQRKK